MFSCIMKEIVRKYDMDISDAFVDGTKLEANANKYKFVWRPGKRHDKLNEGLRTVISAYFPLPAGKKEFISKARGKTDYWTAPDGLEPEVPKEPNMERLIKKLSKKKKDGGKAKYKYRKGTATKR